MMNQYPMGRVLHGFESIQHMDTLNLTTAKYSVGESYRAPVWTWFMLVGAL